MNPPDRLFTACQTLMFAGACYFAWYALKIARKNHDTKREIAFALLVNGFGMLALFSALMTVTNIYQNPRIGKLLTAGGTLLCVPPYIYLWVSSTREQKAKRARAKAYVEMATSQECTITESALPGVSAGALRDAPAVAEPAPLVPAKRV